jgi:lysophospholipid acyltransferase (LPLAT)-like uncharacterized protein
MKLRDPRLIRVVAWLLAVVLRLWLSTLRFRLGPGTLGRHPVDPRRERYLYAVWHEHLLAPIPFGRRMPIAVLISLHADGELISRICGHLGVGVVRGSSTRGGAQAMLELRERSDRAHLVLMPDGPRGPRRVVQNGLIFLASRTGLPIVPLGIGCTWSRRARSWDRFLLPLPFSRITADAGEPIAIPPDLDRDELEPYRRRVEEAFKAVTAEAERRAELLAGRRIVPAPHAKKARPVRDASRT